MCTLLVVVTHAGLGWLLVCFFALLASNGIVLPNGTAAAMGGGQDPRTTTRASAERAAK